uniref:SURF1-like protein n=1 Tax=Cyprinus carpio TaxID=7962 RepID=A0A8C1YT06_CYPCA
MSSFRLMLMFSNSASKIIQGCVWPSVKFRCCGNREGEDSFLKWLLLLIPATTFCLGIWQIHLKRRKWKLELIRELQNLSHCLPIKQLEYRRVKVRGHSDHSKELYVLPCSPVDPEREAREAVELMALHHSTVLIWGTNTHNLNSIHLIPITILVNRGYVTKDKIRPETRMKGQVIPFFLVSRGIVPQKNVEANRWHYRDPKAMALKKSSLMLCLVRNSTIPDGPIGGQTRVTLRNEHRQYVITWYGLCAATSYMWYAKFIKRIAL